MRALLLAAASLALAGCAGPEYYLSGVSATFRFVGDAWSVENATAGLRAANYTVTYIGANVQGRGATSDASTSPYPNGTIELTVSYAVHEKTGTRERALQRAEELHYLRGQEAYRILLSFERGSGWSHDFGPAWNDVTLHGD